MDTSQELVKKEKARYDADMRYLGIDFGTKKIGLALSDEAGTMGFPRGVIANDEKTRTHILELIKKEQVEGVVIGESKDFHGKENAVAREARAFAEDLEAASGIQVFWEPELFTTQEARRDFEGERTNHGIVDASAAALILTGYLERIKS